MGEVDSVRACFRVVASGMEWMGIRFDSILRVVVDGSLPTARSARSFRRQLRGGRGAGTGFALARESVSPDWEFRGRVGGGSDA